MLDLARGIAGLAAMRNGLRPTISNAGAAMGRGVLARSFREASARRRMVQSCSADEPRFDALDWSEGAGGVPASQIDPGHGADAQIWVCLI